MEHTGAPINPDNQAENKTFESMVFNDFYNSFRHSQGVSPAQGNMFVLLGRFYKQNYFPDSQPDWEKLDAYVSPRLEKLPIPSAHMDVEDSNRIIEFNDQWEIEKEILKKVFDPSLMGEDDDFMQQTDLELIAEIANNLGERESVYMQGSEGRPFRISSEDPYQSMLRGYLLGECAKGLTPGFKSIYESMKSLLWELNIIDHSEDKDRIRLLEGVPLSNRMIQSIQFYFNSLVKGWEFRHPKQKFFPERPLPESVAA